MDIKTFQLSTSRLVAASPEQLYDAWLDAERPGGPWYGVTKVVLNPTVDGLFYHLVHFEGCDYAHYGRFLTLDRPNTIENTWVSPSTRGLESVVRLTFEKRGENETRVLLEHSNLPDDEDGRRHELGWKYCLDMLDKLFEPSKDEPVAKEQKLE